MLISAEVFAQQHYWHSVKDLCAEFKDQYKYYDLGNDTASFGISKDSLEKILTYDYNKAIKRNPDSLNLYVDFYNKMKRYRCSGDCYVQYPEHIFWEAEKHCNEKQIIYPILVRSMTDWIDDYNNRLSSFDGKSELIQNLNIPNSEKYIEMCTYLERNYSDSISIHSLEYFYLTINASADKWNSLLQKAPNDRSIIEKNISIQLKSKDDSCVSLLDRHLSLFHDNIYYYNNMAAYEFNRENYRNAYELMCECNKQDSKQYCSSNTKCDEDLAIASVYSLPEDSINRAVNFIKVRSSNSTTYSSKEYYEYYDLKMAKALVNKGFDSLAKTVLLKSIYFSFCEKMYEIARFCYKNEINDKTLTDSLVNYANRNGCKGVEAILKHGYLEDTDYHNYGYVEFNTINSFSLGLGYSRQFLFDYNRSRPLTGYNIGTSYDFIHNVNVTKAGFNFSGILNLSADAAIINNFNTYYFFMPASLGLGGLSVNLSYTRNFFLPKDNAFNYPLNQLSLKILFSKNNFGWWVFDEERRD